MGPHNRVSTNRIKLIVETSVLSIISPEVVKLLPNAADLNLPLIDTDGMNSPPDPRDHHDLNARRRRIIKALHKVALFLPTAEPTFSYVGSLCFSYAPYFVFVPSLRLT